MKQHPLQSARQRRRTGWPKTAALLIAGALAWSGSSAWAQDPPADIVLPKTLDKVWYRAGQKKGLAGLRVFKAAGDLTLSTEGLEFHGSKDSFSIPLGNVTMVSYGKLGRDVDTDWAVLGLREGGLDRIIAFKDGKALGYGQNTPLIFQTIKEVMRQLDAAQYAAPAGFQSFTMLDDQLAFPFPEGWSVQVPSSISIGNRTPWGMTLFSSEKLDGGPELAEGKAIRQRAQDGVQEFFLAREEAAANRRSVWGNRSVGSCAGIKSKALPILLKRAVEDPLFDKGFGTVESLGSQPVPIAGCEGLRVLAKGQRDDGQDFIVDLRIVAKRDTLYTFGLRVPAEEHDERLKVFDRVIASMRFALAVE